MSITAAAPPRPWLMAARLGFAARALVYFLVGWLTLGAALHGGAPSSNTAAMASIQDKPLGHPLLLLVALGLAIYAVWRIADAVFDPDHLGHDARGIVKRVGFAFSAIAHVGFAWYAIRLGLGQGGGASAESWSIWLLHKPAGNVLLGAIGLGLLAAGFEQFRRAWSCSFLHELEGDVPAPHHVRWIGRIGYGARGIVFALVAWALVRAAWHSHGQEAGGMREAFQQLRDADHGRVLLAIVAIGFCLFGVFCALQVRYQRIGFR